MRFKRLKHVRLQMQQMLKRFDHLKRIKYNHLTNILLFCTWILGLVGDNAPALYPNYWGGNKFKVIEELRKQGYNVHQASVSAFGSNYDRAVELYYYIKGGRVDYGAAHAAKYGHERYGKTYKGIMPNWEPGKRYIL